MHTCGTILKIPYAYINMYFQWKKGYHSIVFHDPKLSFSFFIPLAIEVYLRKKFTKYLLRLNWFTCLFSRCSRWPYRWLVLWTLDSVRWTQPTLEWCQRLRLIKGFRKKILIKIIIKVNKLKNVFIRFHLPCIKNVILY